MAELATGHTGTQTIVTDTDGVVLEGVGEVIVSLGHGSDEDTNALLGAQRFDIVPGAHHGGFVTEGDLAAVGGQVVGDGVLDDAEEFLLRGGGADAEVVEELDHEAGEAFEGSGDTDGRGDFDEDTFGGVDVDLEFAGFVDGGVEKSEEALREKGVLVDDEWSG